MWTPENSADAILDRQCGSTLVKLIRCSDLARYWTIRSFALVRDAGEQPKAENDPKTTNEHNCNLHWDYWCLLLTFWRKSLEFPTRPVMSPKFSAWAISHWGVFLSPLLVPLKPVTRSIVSAKFSDRSWNAKRLAAAQRPGKKLHQILELNIPLSKISVWLRFADSGLLKQLAPHSSRLNPGQKRFAGYFIDFWTIQ